MKKVFVVLLCAAAFYGCSKKVNNSESSNVIETETVSETESQNENSFQEESSFQNDVSENESTAIPGNEYDADGNLVKEYFDGGYTLYENKRISKVVYETDGKIWREDVYEYDEKGHLLSDGNCNWWDYDENGNCIRHQWRSEITEYEYDSNGKLINEKHYSQD